jgi:hypothetical protein
VRDPHETHLHPPVNHSVAAPHEGRLPPGAYPGLEAKRNGTAGVVSVCLAEECRHELVDELVQALKTGRGQPVKGPATCVQPVASRDIDDAIVGDTSVVPTVLGQRVVLLRFATAQNQAAIIKGFNAFAVQLAAATPIDPYSRIRFTVRHDGLPVEPYREMAFQPGVGLAGLRASTLILHPEHVLTLEVERYAGAGTDGLAISAVWKGWTYLPLRSDTSSPALALEGV